MDQQVLGQKVQLGRVRAQPGKIGSQFIGRAARTLASSRPVAASVRSRFAGCEGERHPTLDTAFQGAALVRREVVPRAGTQQLDDRQDRIGSCQGTIRRWTFCKRGVPLAVGQGIRDCCDLPDLVHQPGGDGARWHAVVAGLRRSLCEHQAACVPDRPQPNGTVGAIARQYHANRASPIFGGQGCQQEIKWQTRTTGRLRLR